MSVDRRKTAQMPGVRQSVQPVVESDHAQPEAHGLQAVRVRPLRPSISAQSRSPPAQGDAAHGLPVREPRVKPRVCFFFFRAVTNPQCRAS